MFVRVCCFQKGASEVAPVLRKWWSRNVKITDISAKRHKTSKSRTAGLGQRRAKPASSSRVSRHSDSLAESH